MKQGTSEGRETIDADVVVVGGGLAGLAAATGMARQGVRVVLADPRARAAPSFKAEKLEHAQARLLDVFGLLEPIEPLCGRIQHVVTARGSRRLSRMRMMQWGIPYHDLVNGVRAAMPDTVERRLARVERLETSPDVQTVRLDDGSTLRSRLVVLAAGVTTRLGAELGLARRMIADRFSLTAGVSVARADGGRFDFDALTVYPASTGRTAYVSFFRIAEAMRVNVFTFQDVESAWVRRFRAQPIAALEEALPGTQKLTGKLVTTSKPSLGPIDLWTMERPVRDGLVLLGDAFQSVCPSTGSGLTKALTDADVLAHDCVPAWLGSPGMGADKIAGFYAHARKLAADRDSLEAALYRRRVTLERSLKLTIHREAVFLGMRAAASMTWVMHLFE